MKTIAIDNDNFIVPSKWNDLAPEQVMTLAKLVQQNASYFNISVKFCLYLLGLKPKLYHPILVDGESLYYVRGKSNKNKYLLSTAQVHALVKSFSWLFVSHRDESDAITMGVNPLVNYNPVKDIKVRFTKLRGPDDVLGNISWMEFIFAETFLTRYNMTGDIKWLAQFLAVLWRPLKDGNILPFEQSKVERQACRTIRINHNTALVATWFYAGCKAFLAKKYPRALGGSGGGKQSDPFEGYMDLTVTLAKTDKASPDSVLGTNLHFVLKSLDIMLQQQQQQKR